MTSFRDSLGRIVRENPAKYGFINTFDIGLWMDELEDRLDVLLDDGERRLEDTLDVVMGNVVDSLPHSYHRNVFFNAIAPIVGDIAAKNNVQSVSFQVEQNS